MVVLFGEKVPPPPLQIAPVAPPPYWPVNCVAAAHCHTVWLPPVVTTAARAVAATNKMVEIARASLKMDGIFMVWRRLGGKTAKPRLAKDSETGGPVRRSRPPPPPTDATRGRPGAADPSSRQFHPLPWP